MEMAPPGPEPRRIGSYPSSGDPCRSGPLVIAIGGMHGNEPAGVFALERVLESLAITAAPLRGRLVGFRGNTQALRERVRYLDFDMNRGWNPLPDPTDSRVEAREIRALNQLIEREIADYQSSSPTRSEVIILDLHSTSGGVAPFAILADTLRNRRIALHLELTAVLGLEESIQGTLLEYMSESGHIAVCIEGGQHDDPTTVDNLESALFLSLIAADLLDEAETPGFDEHKTRLTMAGLGFPPVVEITYRHPIQSGSEFRMLPGFKNFQLVRPGDLLAHEGNQFEEPVKAPRRGRLLMPLYQAQGAEGFFLVERVELHWLALSAWLRRLKIDRGLTWLPGVRAGDNAHEIRVDKRVARFLARELFHLFGYRKFAEDEHQFIFRRRREA